MKIRRGNLKHPNWITLKTGETINLPERVGINNCLEKVTNQCQNSDESVTDKGQIKLTEGQIGDKKVETKQIVPELQHRLPNVPAIYTPDDLFFKELKKINGIGNKTAKDIVTWGTKEKLIEVIEIGGGLPFRNDVEELLRRKYAK